jgi:hypothetical protein
MRVDRSFMGFIVGAALSGCANTVVSTPTIPTPTIAANFANLPRSGSIVCNSEGSFSLWELPGLTPGDLNSATYSNRGGLVGSLKPCTKVQIEAIQWSTWDKMFYVRVAVESEHGWITEDFVVVDEPAKR